MFDAVVWFSLVGLAFFVPPVAGLGLLFGYVLGDKSFALINIAGLIRLPLFITEPVLFLLFIRAIFLSRREGRLESWGLDRKSPWLYFYAVGLVNAAIGLVFAGPVTVARDAVIVFYGVVAQIAIAFVRTDQHVKTILLTIVAALAVRLVAQFFSPAFDHSSTTFGMYAAITSISVLCSLPLWGRWKWPAVAFSMLLIGIMTATDTRTVWVGFFIAFVFTAALHFALRLPKAHLRTGVFAIFGAILMSMLFLRVAVPMRYELIKHEFVSMFAGVDSPNLMTRVAMWEDAIEAIFPPAGRLFNRFDKQVLNPYYFGTSERPSDKRMEEYRQTAKKYTSSDPSATTILDKFNESPSRGPGLEKLSVWLGNNTAIRMLFGAPFGERFVPTRIAAIHQVNRYDPHNSIIAIFYRTGVLGLTFFLAIVVCAYWRAYRSLQGGEMSARKYLLVSVMAAGVYHLAHSMTDVTLENPFRGAPFWLLLGLMTVLAHRNWPEKRP